MRTVGKWLVAGLVVLAACGGPSRQIVGFDFTPYAHQGEPFARELFKEHAAVVPADDPTLGFRAADVDDRYIHVHDYARTSWTPAHPTVTVWFFGGSALFGVGQRDDHTIPSEVARLAHADGVEVRAVNYGTSAYVRWQEVALYKRLLRTHRAPDLVVFYDGVNDYALACRAVPAGVKPRGRQLTKMHDVKGQSCEAPEVEADMVGELGNTPKGAVAFMQPDAYTVTPPAPKLWARLKITAPVARDHTAQVRSVAERTGMVDLSGVFDGRGPMLFDWAHTNEAGARIVAEAMWPDLRAKLQASGSWS